MKELNNYILYCSNLDDNEYNLLWEYYNEQSFLNKIKEDFSYLFFYVIYMEDKYEGLSDEELKEIFEDMEADYWIDYYQSLCE